MEPFVLKEKEYFVIDEWAKRHKGLLAGFTTKNGGFSKGSFSTMNLGLHVSDCIEDVQKNRQQMASILDFPLRKWVSAEQTHEMNIEKVTFAEIGRGSLRYEDSFKRTDGFFTQEKGILTTLCYADCVPLFFLHEKTGVTGIAHAGWKGTVGGIAIEMVSVFENEGMEKEDIQVIIGPSICKDCYLVDTRVITFVEKLLEDHGNKPYNQIEDDQYKLDLKQLNKQLLLKAGIMEENIRTTNLCTSCHDEHFFSHRRDKGKTGRMMSFLGWKEDLEV
ncbi:peptidoglycan editing factor PgeF [Bacillus sp. Bva_UNVM-123]|uniref:peptidoglycan editing factor PgeF n=1 Tax=Bacillus sp. Bva_UNVM-123 TaxID=2829798 RepID=UPI00391F3E35